MKNVNLKFSAMLAVTLGLTACTESGDPIGDIDNTPTDVVAGPVTDDAPQMLGSPITDGVTYRNASIDNALANSWFQDAASSITQGFETRDYPGTAKNVILFVGDGMGISTVTQPAYWKVKTKVVWVKRTC